PTILSEVKPGMPVFDEEVFGPVISISHYESIDDLLNMVNSSVFGLGASIWTKDINFAKRLINKVYVGNVFINSSVRSDPRLPYGGVKLSGYGRELGYIGIREFTNVKTVVVKSLA
ncbi:MAG: aldehyde dehydrogenase family protein, partial [Candidatus Dojkabacteria bacterium]|nr:aldehyde dehydrogenase family protein [Candidatus Dojkabacteria bacterium]